MLSTVARKVMLMIRTIGIEPAQAYARLREVDAHAAHCRNNQGSEETAPIEPPIISVSAIALRKPCASNTIRNP